MKVLQKEKEEKRSYTFKPTLIAKQTRGKTETVTRNQDLNDDGLTFGRNERQEYVVMKQTQTVVVQGGERKQRRTKGSRKHGGDENPTTPRPDDEDEERDLTPVIVDQIRAVEGIYIPPVAKPEPISKTDGPVVLNNVKAFVNAYKHSKNEYLQGHFKKQVEVEQ